MRKSATYSRSWDLNTVSIGKRKGVLHIEMNGTYGRNIHNISATYIKENILCNFFHFKQRFTHNNMIAFLVMPEHNF